MQPIQGEKVSRCDRKAAGAQGEGAAQTQEPNKDVFTRL